MRERRRSSSPSSTPWASPSRSSYWRWSPNAPPRRGRPCAATSPPCARSPASCWVWPRWPSPSTGSAPCSATSPATPAPWKTTLSPRVPPARNCSTSAVSTRTSSPPPTPASRARRRPAPPLIRATRRAGTWWRGPKTPRRRQRRPHRPLRSPRPPRRRSSWPTRRTCPTWARRRTSPDITAWFNTPGNKPLSLSQLRGKVVLIDFWTYSCINCQRALPHVEGWYNDYKKDGLVVVGVSAPEFAFEHVVSNVESAAGSLGIDYPVAVDDNLATWDAYNNEYWPAEYLIDPDGHRARVRLRRGRLLQHGGQHQDAPQRQRGDRPPASDRRPGQDADERHHAGELRRRRTPEQRGGNRSRAQQGDRVHTRRRPSPRTAWPSVAPGPSTTKRRRRGTTQRSGCSSRQTTCIS